MITTVISFLDNFVETQHVAPSAPQTSGTMDLCASFESLVLSYIYIYIYIEL